MADTFRRSRRILRATSVVQEFLKLFTSKININSNIERNFCENRYTGSILRRSPRVLGRCRTAGHEY